MSSAAKTKQYGDTPRARHYRSLLEKYGEAELVRMILADDPRLIPEPNEVEEP